MVHLLVEWNKENVDCHGDDEERLQRRASGVLSGNKFPYNKYAGGAGTRECLVETYILTCERLGLYQLHEPFSTYSRIVIGNKIWSGTSRPGPSEPRSSSVRAPPPPRLEGNPELVLRKVHLDTLHTGCTPGVPSALSDVVEVFRTPHVL